jgi:thiol-disulfide isomerase/thioredoxin
VEKPKSGNSDDEDAAYMATFDATNLALQWSRMAANYENDQQYKIKAVDTAATVEAAKAPEATPAEAAASPDAPASPTADTDKSASPAAPKPASTEPAASDSNAVLSLSQTEQDRMRVAAREVFELSKLVKEINPNNVMLYVHLHKPFAVFTISDSWRDLELAKALPAFEASLPANLKEEIAWLWITPDSMTRFQLTRVFQLATGTRTTVGDSPNNVNKTVFIPFGKEMEVIPTVSFHIQDECCGDKFELVMGTVTKTGFDLFVKRTDKNEGWGQPLQIEWETVPPVHSLPTLIIDNIPHGSNNEKFVFRPEEYPNQNTLAAKLVSFTETFHAETAKLLVRSMAVPISPPLDRTPGKVVDVVGYNFQDIVLDRTKDVLALIYSPWCGASIAVQPLLEQVAADLKDDTQSFVARIDKTVNDLPVRGIIITHYPTVLLFPACEYGKPDCQVLDFSDFNGSKDPHDRNAPHSHFTKDIMLNFVRAHGLNYQGFHQITPA